MLDTPSRRGQPARLTSENRIAAPGDGLAVRITFGGHRARQIEQQRSTPSGGPSSTLVKALTAQSGRQHSVG
jgi:hypothetical protein